MSRKKNIIFFSITTTSLLITSLLIYYIYSSPALYPVKSAFCIWAADTQLTYGNDGLSEKQQLNIQKHLLPGDILISKMNWCVANIGIPGFWTHAAVYTGTAEERKIFFTDDPEFSAWLRGQGVNDNNFEQFLTSKNTHKILPKKNENEQVIVEALCEGVVLSTFQDLTSKDAVAVLRPKVSKIEIAHAIKTAYLLLDAPYDFDFDFRTDSAIACTELVYRMYGNVEVIPTNQFLNKPFTTCNDIVRYFDETHGTSQQKLDLIVVHIKDKLFSTNDKMGLNEFRSSWKRSIIDF